MMSYFFVGVFNRITKAVYKKIMIILPLKNGVNKSNKDRNIIVSLTTYPKRFDTIYLCLKSLLYQTKKPNRIIVWFGEDVNIESVPRNIMLFKKYGVEFRFEKGNIKSHKKYYYAFQSYPESNIITVDDDVIYSPFTVSSLFKTSIKYPKTICARRVHRIAYNENKVFPYKEWELCTRKFKLPRMDLIGIGVGAILYPPGSINEKVFDVSNMIKMCPTTDDIWLKCMSVLNDTKTTWVKCLWSHPIPLKEDDEFALENSNIENNINDKSFCLMIGNYPDVFDKIKSEKVGYKNG